jgi:FkbM family methyltransferase
MNFTFRELRDRLHPLNRVRRYSACRQILNVFDVPVWTRMPGVKWKVRARLVRHASSFLLAGGVEPGISCLFRTIAQETGVRSLWDVGANIGYYSWVVKSLVPDCTVRLHEPEPDNLRLIEETIRRAGLDDVIVRPVAVSDQRAEVSFIRDTISGFTGEIDTSSSNFSERNWGIRGESVPVQAVSLDDERAATGRVDLIKIDVEGHEEAVIRGARELINNDEPIVIFECFHGGREINRMLYKKGYTVADAETMAAPSEDTSNFVALPARFNRDLLELAQSWQRRFVQIVGSSRH